MIDKMIAIYIEAMISRRIDFDEQVATRLEADISLLVNFGATQNKPERVKSTLKILSDFKDLFVGPGASIPSIVESILDRYPDFREDMVLYIIDGRDLDRAERRSAQASVVGIFQRRPKSEEKGLFSHLELPGGFFDNFVKDKKEHKHPQT